MQSVYGLLWNDRSLRESSGGSWRFLASWANNTTTYLLYLHCVFPRKMTLTIKEDLRTALILIWTCRRSKPSFLSSSPLTKPHKRYHTSCVSGTSFSLPKSVLSEGRGHFMTIRWLARLLRILNCWLNWNWLRPIAARHAGPQSHPKFWHRRNLHWRQRAWWENLTWMTELYWRSNSWSGTGIRLTVSLVFGFSVRSLI